MPRLLTIFSLLAVAGLTVAFPKGLFQTLGFSPLVEPSVTLLDRGAQGGERSSPRLLKDRNEVVLTVPEETTLGEFLRVRRLRDDLHRRQIAEQLGLESIDTSTLLKAGTELRLRLTPEASAKR